MSTVWWWVVPDKEAGATTRPRDAKLVSTSNSGAQYAAWIQGGSYQGQSRFQGPFTTQAAAKAANPGGGSTSDVIKAGVNAGVSADQTVGGAIGAGVAAATAAKNAASNISSITGFLSALGSANLWIRVVKIVAGSVILFIGVAHLTGLDSKLTGVASKAVAAAPLL